MKKGMLYTGNIILVLITLGALVSGCPSGPDAGASPGNASPPASIQTALPANPTAASVQAYANPVIENLLDALENNDYTGFSRDLGEDARESIDAEAFARLHDQITDAIGRYESVRFFGFAVQNEDTIVTYVAHYTGEPAGVSVTTIFRAVNGAHAVYGFALDSAILRGQSIDVPQIRLYTDPAAENILVSLNDNNYEGFSRDFNPTMVTTINTESFNRLYDLIRNRAGDYQSMEFENAIMQDSNIIVRYLAQYSGEPAGVWITISFDSGQQVAGLFFNSPGINDK